MMPQIKLKIAHLLLTIIAVATCFSCASGINKQSATSKGFAEIEKEIKSKFGEHAFYTDLSISYNKSIGNIISVTVSEVPESLKMEQWNSTLGTRIQSQDISIEVPYGSKASYFIFQLNDLINLSKLGRLVETSCAELSTKKILKSQHCI